MSKTLLGDYTLVIIKEKTGILTNKGKHIHIDSREGKHIYIDSKGKQCV